MEKQTYTFAQADTALSVWEYVIENPHYYPDLQVHGWACTRESVLPFAVRLSAVWDRPEIGEVYDNSFDWEFIPAIMFYLRHNLDATEDAIMQAALTVVME